MSLMYDYDVTSHDDVIVNAAKRALDLFLRVATPEKTALFAAFPILMKLPSWFPGLGLKDANLSKEYVKANGTAQACMVSDALERYEILQDTDNPEMVTEIKASAAAVYAGARSSVDTIFISLICPS
ncbi:hypothetical protein AZE42_08969 [Rhizopogon vesiculosus]|uniref:Uncharacterized protein n=1 Tax=Rhizopogon vesiculosus TaxID=180088 RepID=A0A1J8QGJ1_9AGAM|nr:hypothetical protein AZE42_08969 [Rhizopogon vesiculosus]